MDCHWLLSQGGIGHAGKNGEAYTNSFPISFNIITPIIVAVHRGSMQSVNVVVDAVGSATTFSARSTYTSSTAAIAYIAAGW